METKNSKITIVVEMLGSFSKLTNSTKSNFVKIEESIQDIIHNLNESKVLQSINRLVHIYNALLNRFQTLYLRLNEIETVIAFAKVRTNSIIKKN